MTPIQAMQKMFEIRDTTHAMHLATTSYATHKALNAFYDEWLDLTDSFIETYQGRYKRITGKIAITIPVGISEIDYIKSVYECLEKELKPMVSPTDDDLLNIIADMKALVNKTLYLLTLV